MADLIRQIQDKWSQMQARQVDRYNQIMAALKMYRGDHQWVWDEAGRPVTKPIPTNIRSWSVINIYQQIQRTVVANLMKGDLVGQVYPLNASPEAREKAKATQALLEYLIKRSGYHEALAESIHWALLSGDAFLKVMWDENQDNIVVNGQVQKHGGVRVTAPCPQSILVDKTAIDLADTPWILHEVIMSKEMVKRKFQIDWNPEEDASGDSYSTLRLISSGMTKSRFGHAKNGVRVFEYWERPSREYPGGVFTVIANQKYLVEPQPWPFPRLPFVHWRVEVDPGQFTGRTFMWDLISIQKAMDTAFGSILDHVKKMPRPALMAPRGAIVGGRIEQHTGREIIEYDLKKGRPTELPPPRLDAWLENFIKNMSSMMDIVSGVGAPVQGRAPYAQATGRAMAFLIEMDQVKMGPMARRLGTAVVETSKLMLEIQRMFQVEPIMIKIQNLDGFYDYLEFKREDLEYGDIDIDVGSIVSSSQAVLQETVQQWVHLGIMDPQEARRLLSIGPRSWEDLDPYAQDRAWAKMNIGRILEGQEPTVKDYMAWSVHYEVTAEWMKGKEYLLETPPFIQQRMEQYLAYLQEQAQGNIAAQQQMAEGPEGAGQSPMEGAGTPGPGNQGAGPGGSEAGVTSLRGQIMNSPQGGNPQEEAALQGAMRR